MCRTDSSEFPMAEIITLREAVAALVRDGDTVAMEGFTHLIPLPPATKSSVRAASSSLWSA
jgi:glutaconate CoA-transferase subunit A